MINEIIRKYEDFSDCLILGFNYLSYSFEFEPVDKLEILISCYNADSDYRREIIKLTIGQVFKWKFNLAEYGSNSTSIYSALIKEENGVIILDFFPVLGDVLELDPESDFYVFGKEISYETVAVLSIDGKIISSS